MMGDREMDRILGAWAREGVDTLPDRLVDAVLADVARVPQRHLPGLPTRLFADRPWLRLVAVLAALLTLIAAAALIAGNPRQPQGKAFRGGDELLEPGRYVIDAPFDFHLSIDVPAGWLGVEEAGGWAELAVGSPEPRPRLVFATITSLPIDPCSSELGVQGPFPPGDAADVLQSLATLPGMERVVASDAVIGGRPARLFTVVGGEDGTACANGHAFTLWSLAEAYTLDAGVRHRIWIVDVDGRQLAVAARDRGPDTQEARDLDGMVASLLLGDDAPARPSGPPRSAAPDNEPPIPSLPAIGPIQPREDGYVAHFTVYAYGVQRTPQPVERQHDWVMPVYGAWTRTSHGMAYQSDKLGGASLSIWSVGKVYVDPCHWRTSSLQLVGPENLAEYEQVASSLSDWWGPAPSDVVSTPGYTPPAFSPLVSVPVLQGYPGKWSRHLELVVPLGFDLADCDNGEYRIWEDNDGTPRTAQPGERINVRVALLETGVVVLEGAYLSGAGQQLRTDLMEMLNSSALLVP